MSGSIYNIGLSGMTACQGALSVTANNIANANTAGFQPQLSQFQELVPPGSGVELAPPPAPAPSSSTAASSTGTGAELPSGVDLANELVQMLDYKTGYEANAQVVKTSDQLLGTLLDVMG